MIKQKSQTCSKKRNYEVDDSEENTEMEQARLLLSWILLLQGTGAASANTLVNGALGGSAQFDVTLPSQATGLIQWSFKNGPAAQLAPGSSSPTCFGQIFGRCKMFANGSLILNNITYNDEGTYTVTAYDATGGSILKTENYDLKVYVAASANTAVNGSLGGSVQFDVTPGQADGSIQWIFKNGPAAQLSPGSSSPLCFGQFFGRCKMFVNGSLILTNITYNDEGTYTINVYNTGGSILMTENYDLKVYGAASANTAVNGALGGSVQFDVTLPSQATGLITWSFNNGPAAQLAPGSSPLCFAQFFGRCKMFVNGSLILTNITYKDDGTYTINVYNTGGTIVMTENYDFKVYVPVPANTAMNGTVGGSVQFDVTLPSQATGLITWSFKNGPAAQLFPGSSSPTCFAQFFGRCQVFVNGSLILNSITSNDEGTYTVNAYDATGGTIVMTENYDLNVYAPVSAVTLTSNTSALLWVNQDSVSLLCSASGTDVSFSWTLQGAPLPNISRYRLSENNSTLIISPVTRDDSGLFTCLVSNMFNSENSNGSSLNLAWPPDDQIKCAALLFNNYTSLLCSWQGGRPAAQLTLLSQDIKETGNNEVIRNISSEIFLKGLDLTCHGIHVEKSEICSVHLAPPLGPTCSAPSQFLKGGEIAGIVIGVVILIIILEVIVFIILRRLKKTPPSVVYENESTSHPSQPHLYEETMPGAEKSTNQESNYEQLTHKDNGQYETIFRH